MASTRSILAISGTESCGFLNRITDVREITRRLCILDRRPMSSSVIPSARYSWVGSPDRFFKGSTAKDLILGCAAFPGRPRDMT